MREDLKYWLAFSLIAKITPQIFQKIYKNFPDLSFAWEKTNLSDFLKIGLKENIAQEIITNRKRIDLDKEMERLEKEKIKILTLKDKNYPFLLKKIFDPPFVLFIKGDLRSADLVLAVVGTRKPSVYGIQVTEHLVYELASKFIIVSGLALGIDGKAHETTLKREGKTWAVLGTGLDRNSLYPSSHRYLAEKIIKTGGVLISEYPCGTLPLKYNFPRRNRLIAGLSLGTLVIEASESSGALITAFYALEENRDVFAVPGNIYHLNSQGTNKLIKMGARIVCSAQDIFENYHLKFSPSKKDSKLSSLEEKVLILLKEEPKNIDELIKVLSLDTQKLLATLTFMEMKGLIKNLGDGRFANLRYL